MGLSNYVSTYQNDYSGSNRLSNRHRSKSTSALNIHKYSTGRVPTSGRPMSQVKTILNFQKINELFITFHLNGFDIYKIQHNR